MSVQPPLRFPLPVHLTPRRGLAALRGLPGRVLLETARGERGWSLLSAAPPLVAVLGRNGLEIQGPADPPVPLHPFDPRDPFAFLAALPPSGGPGGWMGYVGYEVADLLERLPSPPGGGPGLPPLRFGAHDWWVRWEGRGAVPVLEGAPLPGREGAEGRCELRARLLEVQERLLAELDTPFSNRGMRRQERGVDWRASPRTARSRGESPSREGPSPGFRARDDLPPGVWSSLPREAFQEGVEAIRRHILAGDLFQANLTQLLRWPVAEGSGEALYRTLAEESPAPYAAYMDAGAGEIASVSPEAFLSRRGDRVVTRPIKGTAPRDPDPDRDGRAREALVASAKDRAENVMIVDLLRNDLSRVSLPGSVAVLRLAEVESHPTVHHLVSTVAATLRPGVGCGDLLRAAFPGGSITGAPKIRAMELLRGIEPLPRGVYTGALGLITFGGDMELSIAIRTAVVAGGWAWYGSGGGITLASDPDAEWRESLVKAEAFLRAVASLGDKGGQGKE